MIKSGDYEFVEIIGEGAFGVVYKVINLKTRRIYASKMIKQSETLHKIRQVLREVKIGKLLNHQNIIKFYEMKKIDENYYLFFEYVNGPNLLTLIKKEKYLPEEKIRKILRQIVDGLDAVYSKHILHRDIKPANILINYESEENQTLNEFSIKIGDFGSSIKIENDEYEDSNCGFQNNFLENEREMSFVGTPLYSAPEILKEEPYSIKADIWSLGITIFELAIGEYPFKAKNDSEFYKKIGKGIYSINKQIPLSSEFFSFINKCLQYDPDKRFTWNELKNHEFLTTDKYNTFNYEKFKLINNYAYKTSENSTCYYFSSKFLYNFDFDLMSTDSFSISENFESSPFIKSTQNKKNKNLLNDNNPLFQRRYTVQLSNNIPNKLKEINLNQSQKVIKHKLV